MSRTLLLTQLQTISWNRKTLGIIWSCTIYNKEQETVLIRNVPNLHAHQVDKQLHHSKRGAEEGIDFSDLD